MLGESVHSWVVQLDPVLVGRFVRNKNQPLGDDVELMKANLNFAHIRLPDGRPSMVSVTDLAPPETTASP